MPKKRNTLAKVGKKIVSFAGDSSPMTRLLLSLATKLRLSPQSRCDAKTVGRQPSRPTRPLWD